VGLVSGQVRVSVSKAGFDTATMQYEQLQESKVINVRLMRSSESVESLGPQPKVRGTVYDRKNNPIPEVEVTLTSGSISSLKRVVISNADGSFEIESLANAEISLSAKK